jgi:hypothetical protein
VSIIKARITLDVEIDTDAYRAEYGTTPVEDPHESILARVGQDAGMALLYHAAYGSAVRRVTYSFGCRATAQCDRPVLPEVAAEL